MIKRTTVCICFLLAGLLAVPGGSFAAPQGTLRVALTNMPNSLDLCYGADRQASNAGWRLYDSLVVVDDSGAVAPALAESWDISADSKTYTMHLRKGVTFHNGEKFDADAVLFSWNRGKKEGVTWNKKWAIVKAIDKIDDYTIKLQLDAPYPLLLRVISYFWNIVPPGYLKAVGEDGFAAHPMGTGPFRMVEWKKGDRIVYEANPDYWDKGRPKVKNVILRPIPESTTRVAAIQTGEIDIVPRISPEEAKTLEGKPNVKVIKYAVDRVFYIAFNNLTSGKGKPTENAKVRQAMNYAVDMDAIIDALFDGQAMPLTGFLVPSNFAYDKTLKPFPYDPDKARRLLAEAGYPDGFKIGFACPAGAYSQFEQVCEAIQGYLNDVGIETELTIMESGKYWDLEAKKELPELFGDSWACREGEPLERLDGTLGGWEQAYSSWSDPKLDELLKKIGTTADDTARAALYVELQRHMQADPPFIYLYQPVTFEAINPKVKNYKPRAAEDYFLKDVSIDQ